MSPESVRGFGTKTCAKTGTYSMSRESFFTRHAVVRPSRSGDPLVGPEHAAEVDSENGRKGGGEHEALAGADGLELMARLHTAASRHQAQHRKDRAHSDKQRRRQSSEPA